jgi:hypothetical protein
VPWAAAAARDAPPRDRGSEQRGHVDDEQRPGAGAVHEHADDERNEHEDERADRPDLAVS